jgi:hypothetical protein
MQGRTAMRAVGMFYDAYQVEIGDSRSCRCVVQACTNSVQAGTPTQRIPLQAAQAAAGYSRSLNSYPSLNFLLINIFFSDCQMKAE